MWGFHDHFLILRTALHRVLTTAMEKEGLKRRWKHQTQLRNDEAGGLTFSEVEWEFEWEEIMRIATNKPRQQRTTDSLRRYSSLRVSYESLEEVHIFALAHTLRRPIVVISDCTVKDHQGQDLAPIYFGGIYLPLELSPNSCSKSPVVLAFDSSHFSALVAKQNDSSGDKKQKGRGKVFRSTDRKESVIPLVTPDGSLLPVQFIHDPEKNDGFRKWGKMQYEPNEFPDKITGLLESYLNIRWIQLKVTGASPTREASSTSAFPIQVTKVRFPAADMGQDLHPQYQKELVEKYLEHIKARYAEEKEKKTRWQAEMELQEKKKQQNKTVPCEGEGCEMFGRPATNNLCSVCYQKKLKKEKDLEESGGRQVETATGSGGLKPEAQEYYDQEEEEDIANMHRRLIASEPSPFPPTYSEHVRRRPSDMEGPHSSRSPGHVSQDVSDVQEMQKSPTHSSQFMGFKVSPRRGLHDGGTTNKTSPTHALPSQHDPKFLASGSQGSGRSVKQPVVPLKMTRVSPSRNTGESGWVDSIYSDQPASPRNSSSPVKEPLRNKKPLSLPKRFSPPPEYEAPPTSELRTKRVSPPPETEAPPSVPPKTRRVSSPQSPEVKNSPPLAPRSKRVVSPSPEPQEPPPLIPESKRFPSPTPRGEISTPNAKNSSACVHQKLGEVSPTKRQTSYPGAKSNVPSSASGSRYARDNIQPLHLDPMQQTSGGSYSRGTGRSKCKTPNCDFFGNSKLDGYCSSCAKNSLDSQTTLV